MRKCLFLWVLLFVGLFGCDTAPKGGSSPDVGLGGDINQPAVCPDIPAKGCCNGQFLLWCNSGIPREVDCGNPLSCGWNPQIGEYDCGTDGKQDASGVYPRECPGTAPPVVDVSSDTDTVSQRADILLDGDAGEPHADTMFEDVNGDDSGVDCVSECLDITCGQSGDCFCGSCADGFTCYAGTCIEDVAPDCVDICAGKDCGILGACDCGTCGDGFFCNAIGVCEKESSCTPDCFGKQCGDDTCGGSCGLCPCVGCDPNASVCNALTGKCEAADALTCTGINDCMANCNPNDQACIQNCMNQGSPAGQQQLNDLIQCLVDNGAQQCPPGDAQCQNDIITADCMDEYTTCFPGGVLTCAEMFDCMTDCSQDQTCLQDCYTDGSVDAQSQYQEIASCVVEQCGDQPSEECYQAAQQGPCSGVFADCYNLGKPGFPAGSQGVKFID